MDFNEFINKIWLQNCGDSLKILEKTNIKRGKCSAYLWRCVFQKYPYEILAQKENIIKGKIINPQIEQKEFIEKVWLQKCGDTLRIIRKTDIKKGKEILFECEFLKYPFKTLAAKSTIKLGAVNNPQIEQIEFIDKIWHQNCGDDLKIIKKSDKKREGRFDYLWECEFIKYPYQVFVCKRDVIGGFVLNQKLPWLNQNNLIKYIKENFKHKPTLQELADSFNLSRSYINAKINKFGLNDFIRYDYSGEENQIRDFIKSIYQGPIEKYCGTKEEKFREIDIFFPELKRGIEYNSFPWHEEGNPNNPYSKPIGYHKEKQEIFAKKGIEILFVWNYEWFKDFPNRQIINEQTKQKIKDFLQI